MPLYFAYGPTMDMSKLQAICSGGTIKQICVARLTGYDVGFRSRADTLSGVPDLLEDRYSAVWGVLFDLDATAMDKLEAVEGVSRKPVATETLRVQVAGRIGASPLVFGPVYDNVVVHRLASRGATFMPPNEVDFSALLDIGRSSQLPAIYLQRIAVAASAYSLFDVEDVKLGAIDTTGSEIIKIHSKQAPHYAVYEVEERVGGKEDRFYVSGQRAQRVAVQYADDPVRAADQRNRMASLNGVRSQIAGLLNSASRSPNISYSKRASRYNRQVAAALVLCLEGDGANPLAALNEVKTDILAERASFGRMDYLKATFITSALLLVLLSIVAHLDYWQRILQWQNFIHLDDNLATLWLAARAGVVGAFFSIAFGLRSRTLVVDVFRLDNYSDAVLRLMIGGIAAGVLVLMLSTKFAPTFSIGSGPPIGPIVNAGFETILVLGFLAGFSERLLPDLLQSKLQPNL